MAKQIKIEKGIPIPRIKRNSSKVDYPFEKLKIGDSFKLRDGDYFRSGQLKAAISKALKIKLIVRTMKSGPRIWRVA